MAKVACPACRQMNSFPAITPGAELTCQHCGQSFRIRGQANAQGSSTPPQPAAPAMPAILPPLNPNEPLPPLDPRAPLAPVAPASPAWPAANPFAAQAPLSPLAPLHPEQSVAAGPTPWGAPPTAPAPFAPLSPLPSSSAAGPATNQYGASFGMPPAKPTWNPPTPEPPRSNHAAIIIGIAGFCALALLFCGGVGFLLMNARSRVVAAAKRAEEQNAIRQQELQRQMQLDMQRQIEQQQRQARELSERRRNAANQPKSSTTNTPRPAPNPDTGQFSPPPGFPPPDFAPPSGFAPPPGFPRAPRKPATNDNERLDQILDDLKRSDPSRPHFVALSQLDAMPVIENRRGDVATVLDALLRSGDPSTSRGALRAIGKWGTEANVATLTSLLDSPDLSTRWEAIRALPKLSKTEATAESLAAKLGDFSNIGPLRDAFKELGAVGEPALIKHISATDRMTRQGTHMILSDVGGVATRDALRELVKSEQDFGMKVMAQQTLRRVEARNP